MEAMTVTNLMNGFATSLEKKKKKKIYTNKQHFTITLEILLQGAIIGVQARQPEMELVICTVDVCQTCCPGEEALSLASFLVKISALGAWTPN